MKKPIWIRQEEALKLVQSNMHIVVGMVAAEPLSFLSQLHTIDSSIDHVTILNCLPMVAMPFYSNPQYAPRFQIQSWFISGNLRKAMQHGQISYIPNHLHLAGVRWLDRHQPDIYIGVATPANAEGMMSLSVSNVYEKRMIAEAKIVILEVNRHFPFTFGDHHISLDQVDYLVDVDYPITELLDEPISEKDRMIGNFIAPLVRDGSCLQLGIGGIPNAVAEALVTKKDLGVHTEMLTTGFLKLFQAGAITNRHKRLHPGKFVCCFIAGDKALYDFVHLNPDVLVMDGHYVNNPDVIKQNDHQVSINSTIEVDLTGQCCSESIGSKQFSGTGGQSDTATGAVKSKGGQSFITLHSTTMATNPKTGLKEEISKIVSELKSGAIVSLSRNDVDHIVTEYGVAKLRGLDTRARVRAMIKIAHPKFREMLIQEAKQKQLI
jgi:acyl-CoA hydrolase